jgi:hypothetical protein
MHYLLSTLYVYSILLDAVSDYHVTPPVNPDNTAPQLWRVRALTIVSDFFSGRTLGLTSNQLQQLPTGVFSSLTSLRSLTSPVWLYVLRTCVRMSVFDFRAYDVQLKTKLQFKGRVNNNACEQSCTTFCQLYMSTLYYLMRCQIIMLHHP